MTFKKHAETTLPKHILIMKSFSAVILVLLTAFSFPPPHWQNNFEEAKHTANAAHKFILLNFSGSDWCGPCIKMHKEIFDNDEFIKFADENLVLVNADFPRLKKNQLPAAQQSQNDALAEKYNNTGSFPLTLLLSADGKVIKLWDGFPKESAAAFAGEIKQLINAGN